MLGAGAIFGPHFMLLPMTCVRPWPFLLTGYTIYLSPILLFPFLSCRIIALDKCPGVCPIGVCEVACRIVAKAALCILRDDIQAVAGSRQLCAGQIARVEATVHAVRSSFDLDDTEGVLLVDVSNAFNSLNHAVALQNIR